MYFKFQSTSKFLDQKLSDITDQILFDNDFDDQVFDFFIINVIDLKKNLLLKTSFDQDYELSFPIDINLLKNTLMKIFDNFCVQFENANYFPHKAQIKFNNKNLQLGEIQNSILKNILLARDGIKKKYLYSIIWPKDKEIAINKIDTHLTNLKNNLLNEIGLNIQFRTDQTYIRLN